MISEFGPRAESQTSPFLDQRRKRNAMNATAGALGQEAPYTPEPYFQSEQPAQQPASPDLGRDLQRTPVVRPAPTAEVAPRPPATPDTTVTPTGDIPVTRVDQPDVVHGSDPLAGQPTAAAATDPVTAAVLSAFTAKGMQPRDAQDLQYWVDKINTTGGWDGGGNQSYWQSRMAQGQGGVGDYLERPEAGAQSPYSASLMAALQQSLGGGGTGADDYQSMLAQILQTLAASGALNNNPFSGGQ